MGAAESDEFFGNADVTFRGGLSRFFPGRTRPDFGISFFSRRTARKKVETFYFFVCADEKLTAFAELETAIQKFAVNAVS